MPTIQDRVIESIASQIGVNPSTITPESSFSDLDCDSLDIIEIVMFLEDEFHLQISDQEVAKLQTVSQVITYITERHHG